MKRIKYNVIKGALEEVTSNKNSAERELEEYTTSSKVLEKENPR